jgi:hypothetical protein
MVAKLEITSDARETLIHRIREKQHIARELRNAHPDALVTLDEFIQMHIDPLVLVRASATGDDAFDDDEFDGW